MSSSGRSQVTATTSGQVLVPDGGKLGEGSQCDKG